MWPLRTFWWVGLMSNSKGEQNTKNYHTQNVEKGMAQNDRMPPEKKMAYGLICFISIKTSYYR